MSDQEFPPLILELSNVDLVEYYSERLNAGEPFNIMRKEMIAAGFEEERARIIIRETDSRCHKKRLAENKRSKKLRLKLSTKAKWLLLAGIAVLLYAVWSTGNYSALVLFLAIGWYIFKAVSKN